MEKPTERSEAKTPRPPPSVEVWLMAARPKTLPAAAAPVVIGFALAFAEGMTHWPSVAAAMAGALLIQIGTNFANDYFDFKKGADTEHRIGPTRATQAGLIAPDTMRHAMLLAFALALIPGLYIIMRGGWPFLLIGVLSIASGILYTGGPYPLGYLGLGDFFVLIFFGPVAVGGTYYLQTLSIGVVPIVAGLAPGFLSVAILTVNNLRDIEGDRAAGKKTLAVRFGPHFAKAEYLASLLIAGVAIPLTLCLLTQAHPFALASILILIPAIPTIRTVFGSGDGAELNKALAKTGQILLLFSGIFSIGWVL